MDSLAMPKGKVIPKPKRPPDLISKRGIPYWFGPDWVRDLNGTICRIKAIRMKLFSYAEEGVYLHMLSKDGNVNFIPGSIQKEFSDWCKQAEIDEILIGITVDQVIATDWQYIDP